MSIKLGTLPDHGGKKTTKELHRSKSEERLLNQGNQTISKHMLPSLVLNSFFFVSWKFNTNIVYLPQKKKSNIYYLNIKN